MSSSTHNQQNNWAYIVLLLVITAVAAAGILNYTAQTIQEINSLSSDYRVEYKD